MAQGCWDIVASLAGYRTALRSQDWGYQQADDYSAYTRGHDNFAQLQASQPVIDPTYAIWHEIAPAEYHYSPADQVIRHGHAELFLSGFTPAGLPIWRSLENAMRVNKQRAECLIDKIKKMGYPVHPESVGTRGEVAA